MSVAELLDLRRLAQEARTLTQTLRDPKARQLMEDHARSLEAEATALEAQLKG